MKKTFIYMISLLLLGLTACDEDFNKDVAPPQSNEPEDAQNINFNATAVGSAINLNDWDGTSEISMVSVTSPANLPEGTTVSYKLEISGTQDFADFKELPASLSNNWILVPGMELNEAVKEMFGKAPTANPVYYRVNLYVTKGTSAVRYSYTIDTPVLITPISLPIEPAYYLIGDMNSWNPDELIKFSHSGNNVYDDPHFSVTVEVAAETNFKIAPQSAKDAHEAGGNFWDIVFGTAVDGDTSLEGSIVTENAQAIKIESAGFVKISLNMEEYTYKIEPMGEVSPYLYVPGNHQNWAPATAPVLFSENMDLVYDGYIYLDGEYKFTSAPDWDHTNYGNGGEGKLSTDVTAGNINAEAGFYYLKADLNLLTYEQTKTEWGIIGDATPGGWDNSTPMTYNRENNTWTVTADLEGGKDYKFRANNAWDINMGGSPGKLTAGGDNIRLETSGNYTIVLRLSNADSGNTFTITKN